MDSVFSTTHAPPHDQHHDDVMSRPFDPLNGWTDDQDVLGKLKGRSVTASPAPWMHPVFPETLPAQQEGESAGAEVDACDQLEGWTEDPEALSILRRRAKGAEIPDTGDNGEATAATGHASWMHPTFQPSSAPQHLHEHTGEGREDSDPLSGWTEDPEVLSKMKSRSAADTPSQAPSAKAHSTTQQQPQWCAAIHGQVGRVQGDSARTSIEPQFKAGPSETEDRTSGVLEDVDRALDANMLAEDPVTAVQDAEALDSALDAELDPIQALVSLFFPPPRDEHAEFVADLHAEAQRLAAADAAEKERARKIVLTPWNGTRGALGAVSDPAAEEGADGERALEEARSKARGEARPPAPSCPQRTPLSAAPNAHPLLAAPR